MKLRLMFGLLATLIAAAAIVASVALAGLSTRLHEAVVQLEGVVQDVRISKRLEGDLMRHWYAVEQRVVPTEQERVPDPAEAERVLRQHVEEARRLAHGTHEPGLRPAIAAVEDYLAAVERASREGLPVAQATRPAFDRAYTALQNAVDTNALRARKTLELAERWNRLAELGGRAILGVLLVVVAVALLMTNYQVYRPLVEVRTSLMRFARGERNVRAREYGVAELRDIARAFNEMATALERQREEQLRFVASIAHDLRNPLTALSAAASSVAPSRPLPPEPRIRQTLALVARQVERLDRLIEDLLDAARIESGRLDLRIEERDVRDLVRESVELFRPLSERHEIHVSLPDTPLVIRCDPTRISQVLNNLISNAIKYAPGGGRVDVSATRQGRWVVLAVSDQGVGIKPEEMSAIFEPFHRAGPARESIPGVGLGLSVSRRIVERHGGRIEVESTPGRGSTFRVRLPIAGPEPSPHEETLPSPLPSGAPA